MGRTGRTEYLKPQDRFTLSKVEEVEPFAYKNVQKFLEVNNRYIDKSQNSPALNIINLSSPPHLKIQTCHI